MHYDNEREESISNFVSQQSKIESLTKENEKLKGKLSQKRDEDLILSTKLYVAKNMFYAIKNGELKLPSSINRDRRIYTIANVCGINVKQLRKYLEEK